MDPTVAGLLDGLNTDALKNVPEYRIAACRMNPMLFALLYLPHHLTDDEGNITFSEAHEEWYEIIKTFAAKKTRSKQNRNAIVSPRAMGKSTTFFCIGPIWALAYGHTDYISAFSASESLASEHLRTFRDELETNELLREDFPELCRRKNKVRGGPEGDSTTIRRCGNGAVFQARGITTNALGAKVGSKRPSLLLLDDIEGSESDYSEYAAQQRLGTLLDAILPLNDKADVILVGTTTRYDSIMHQIVRAGQGEEVDWVKEEEFKVHHSVPIVENEDGTERSIWEANTTFALVAMNRVRHTKAFAKNFMNDPAAVDSEYWTPDTFTYGTALATRTYLSIDPALSAKGSSDQTGISVVSYSQETGQCIVKFCAGNRLQGEALRDYVLGVLQLFPEVGRILIESNAGGDTWYSVFHDMPVKLVLFKNHLPKEQRFSQLLDLYEKHPSRVLHAEPLYDLQRQMVLVPFGKNDDLVDSVAHAVLRFLKPKKRLKARIRIQHPR